jgi:hypothetical protein
MKKNQERRLHRKNAKLVKEGGTPMQVNRPVKADTTVSCPAIWYWISTDLFRNSVVVDIVDKSVI